MFDLKKHQHVFVCVCMRMLSFVKKGRHSMGSKDDLEIFERQINKILFLLFIYNLL